jgi:hypothetical protein
LNALRCWTPVAGLLLTTCGLAAQAQDRFEIQVYDSETAPPGDAGLEFHVNHAASTSPTLQVSHFTLEPHLGLANWCELGGYFQTILTEAQTFQYAGVKLRFKAKSTVKLFGRVGLAVNLELSRIPQRFELNGWGSEIRPIADLRWDRLYASLNPILSTALAGAQAGRPQLEPAAKVAMTVLPGFALGAEYYAGLSKQVHQLFGAADFASQFIDLNFGVGYGISGDERWVVKAIFGIHPQVTGF